MGRLENRVRRLEERVERGGFAAALARASDEDLLLLEEYVLRVQGAEEAEAAARFEELRAAAIREGWGEDAYRIV